MPPKIRNPLAVFVPLLFLLAPSAAWSQRQWTWIDANGRTRTKAELDKILDENWELVSSGGSSNDHMDFVGAKLIRAPLSGRTLSGLSFSGADLSFADLSGARLGGGAYWDAADLAGADLTGANLDDANLTGVKLDNSTFGCRSENNITLCTHFVGADLSYANLSGANLRGLDFSRAQLAAAKLNNSKLNGASLTDATLTEGDLTDADLSGANLSGVDLSQARLESADLTETELSSAVLNGAFLSDATMTDTQLSGADFFGADLKSAIFEPKSSPSIRGMAAAGNLELLTFDQNPDALFQLRKQFQDGGFRAQERKITYAFYRRQADLDGPLQRSFERAAFDWTCQYGMNPGRALKIWTVLLLLCWILYAAFIHLPGKSGIYRIEKSTQPDHGISMEEQIRPERVSFQPHWLYPLRLLRRELRVLFWAGFFSLMSAFNIGFRDINFGRWLRLLPRTEYDLRAKGWARTVAGFQSLISVYLIALWVLTYFGRPFE